MARPLSRLCHDQCRRALADPRIQASFLRTLHPSSIHRHYSSSKTPSKILSHSTILLQDGLDIQELPLVIRKMDAREFPFTTAMYTGDKLCKMTEEEEGFKMQLQQCGTLQQVFKLLEVPGDKVTSYSAAFALERLCAIQDVSTDGLQSFIKKAIFNELCETVSREIHTLTNDTIITLVKSHLLSGRYEQRHIDVINTEIERRIGDSLFTIKELMSLVDLLSGYVDGSQDLANIVWIHLASRYTEINEITLRAVYQSIKYLPPSQSYVWKLLHKRTSSVWWKLNADEIALITQRMTLCNQFNVTLLNCFGKWLVMNLHNVEDHHLRDIIGVYSHFSFGDTNVIRSLERYVGARIDKMSKATLSLVMEYFRRRRFISTRVFDAVAKDFEMNGDKYDAQETFIALRPFGQLNYVPPNTTPLFKSIEITLENKLSEFDAGALTELLASFVYIERFPVNFVKKVFTPLFLTNVKKIPHMGLRQKTGRFFMELQAAILLEFPKQNIKTVDGRFLGLSLTWLGNPHYKFHFSIGKSLSAVLGNDNFSDVVFEIPRNFTPHLIDFLVIVGNDKNIVAHSRDNMYGEEKKLAIIGVMPDQICTNTKHPTGELAMKKRHLFKLGYTPVEVLYETFTWRCRSAPEKELYLKGLLANHINFSQLDHSTDS